MSHQSLQAPPPLQLGHTSANPLPMLSLAGHQALWRLEDDMALRKKHMNKRVKPKERGGHRSKRRSHRKRKTHRRKSHRRN